MYAVGNYLNSSMSFVQIESMLTHICFNLGFMQKKKKKIELLMCQALMTRPTACPQALPMTLPSISFAKS